MRRPAEVTTAPTGASQPSYGELWRIPGMRPLAVSVGLSRWVLDGMLPVTVVLTCLRLFGSPAVAGLVVFLGTAPGLLLTPFAGALLDRRGRIAFIRLDIFVAMAVFAVLAALIAAGRLTVPVIMIAAVVLSCTRPLAQAGARAQVPTMTPPHLWDRVNAVDTSVFTVVSLTAPAAASGLFGLLGPAPVFMVGAGLLLVTAAVLVRVPETVVATDPASVWQETRTGLRYFLHNRTLIGLALSSSLIGFAPGTIIVVLPIIIVNHMHQSAGLVGLLLAVEQGGAVVALFVAGRLGTRGREVPLMSVCAVAASAGLALILVAPGIPLIAVGLLVVGAAIGPYWVAVYGLRQRRTAPHMFARAFALSYAGNVAGQPLSSALAGSLSSAGSVVPALGVAIAATLLAIVAMLGIPDDSAPS